MPGDRGAGVPCIGDPHVAFVVHVDPVRPGDQTAAEAPEQVPFLVEEEDGIDLRPDAGVPAAALRDPDVAVQGDLDRAGRPPLAALGELAPAVDRAEGVRGDGLGVEGRGGRGGDGRGEDGSGGDGEQEQAARAPAMGRQEGTNRFRHV